ncbi:DMT family transporter [Rubellimicrobium arenae]|uniref:DMT family transporter n=1 Tax=Rubellimicrobium arenae TaxID=2817372 RepID=UPI001B317552|nr:DMT family transporter [Rubellimicrobium arenae]
MAGAEEHVIRDVGRTAPATLAVGLAAIAAGLAAADAAIVRALGGSVHPFVIGFFRAAFGALAVLPWVAIRPGVLRTVYPLQQHALRAGLKLLALVSFFAAFSYGRLTDVTAIAFISPIFVVLGAAAMLRERLTTPTILAVLASFIGALLVIHPDGDAPMLSMGFALVGALLTALIQLMLKSMSSGDRTDTLVVWNLLLTAPMALLPALLIWSTPSPWEGGLLVVQGVLGAACMALMTHAFSLADATIVAPVDFLRLPLVAGLGYAVFGEVVGPATWLGGAIICGSALLATRYSRASAAERNTDL